MFFKISVADLHLFDLVTLMIRILSFTLMRIRILASNKGSKPGTVLQRLIFHTFRHFICKLMRIQIQIIILMRIQILPFNLMRIHA
jgi:hypothetical protein